jgi:hypothetical protein
MTGNDPLVTAQRTARRYWNVDGLAEIYTGCFFLLVPLMNYLWQSASIQSLWLALGGVAVFMAGVAASRPIIITIRARLTYPRTGYVSFKPPRRIMDAPEMALILSGLIAIFVLMAITTDWIGGLIAVAGLMLGLIDIRLGRIMDLPRFYFLGGFSIVAGAVLGLLQPTYPPFFPFGYAGEAFSLLFGAIGIAYLVSGGITLWKYLRANPTHLLEQA